VRLYCPTEGNKDRIDYCNRNLTCDDDKRLEEDKNSICDDETDPNYDPDPDKRICYQEKQVPVHQGIFVHDVSPGGTHAVATTNSGFNEFLFWNYSGKTPCVGEGGHGQEGAEDDGEPARWRSSAFVAVSSGVGATFKTAFKAVAGDVVGIYLGKGPGLAAIETVLDTTMGGPSLDPEAPAGSTITELGLEREGLRGNWLAVSAKMGIEGRTEEEGMAGIYVTQVPNTPRR
jgi:hypothetical protein